MPNGDLIPEALAPLIPVFSVMPFPVSLTGKDNHYVFVNAAFERKYGHTLATLEGCAPGVLTSQGRRAKIVFKGTRNGGWSGQLENVSRQGKRFRVGLRTMMLGPDGILPKLPEADAKPADALFLGVACDAGAEDMRDRAMLEMLFNRILARKAQPATLDIAGEAAQLAAQPKRRKEVYQLLREGRTYKEIAYELDIADATVRVVVAELRKQLGEAHIPRLRRD